MAPTQSQETIPPGSSRTKVIGLILAFAAILSFAASFRILHAQISGKAPNPRVILPLVQCWYRGQVAWYIQTETSDLTLSQQQDVNNVPGLANVLSAQTTAVDDIYHVTNFAQGNVIPSAPNPAGPGNTDPNYTPLWQLSLVTWNPGITPYLLKSEQDILSEKARGSLKIVKTNIVVNCPVIYTPFGGLFPTAKIIGVDKLNDE
jgi:hypothetical protein